MNLFSFSIESVHKAALTIGFIGAALAALGAGVTLWTGAILSKESNIQIEQARATAQQARESSSRLEVETEGLKTENLKLKIELEKERAKRDELQLRLGPRKLTEPQIKNMLHALSPFNQNSVTAEISWAQDDETINYARQITKALSICGINVKPLNIQHLIMAGRPSHGVLVTVQGGVGAQQLSDALSDSGIATNSLIAPPPSPGSSAIKLGLPYDQCAVSIHVMPKAPHI